MAERARIARFFAPLAQGEAGSFLLTDDAAIITPPPGQQLVITTDSVIQHIHVLADATPQQFAQKLMRRNLSDLAAMGATPWRYTLNIHTPRGLSDDWFAAFAAALLHEQTAFCMLLIGGDSTSGTGPIHCTMTCLGLIDAAPLRRNGAQPDDDIYVSGTIGSAALALEMLQHHQLQNDALATHYHAPTPRLELGKMLRGIASSALDISDGLLADLEQLCAASHVGARIIRESLPLPTELAARIHTDANSWRFALSGGDDYELLFTAPEPSRARIDAIATALQLPLTRIGSITHGTGIMLRDIQGKPLPISTTGWEHH